LKGATSKLLTTDRLCSIIALIIGVLILFKGGTLFMNPALIALIVVVVAASLFFVIAKVVGVYRRQESAERKEMTISVLPKTSLGIWSVGLTISIILLFFLIGVLTGSDTFVFKIIWAGAPVAILVTGLTSMIKKRERSVVVLVSMVVGLWFLIGGVWHLLGGD
jgi:hypothetical protein